MELRTEEFQLPEEPKFNYDEVKSWIMERTEVYKGMIYDDTQISQAKADRADLRRVMKALSDRRIQIEREYMKPFGEFKTKINELIGLINEPTQLIDARIKDYEQMKRDEKREKIEALFEEKEKPDWLTLEQIWSDKWLNASTSMKSIDKDISGAIEQVNADMESLESLEFSFEAKEHYKKTLNVGLAIQEGVRIADMMKRKAEEEAQKEAERQAKLNEIVNNEATQIINRVEAREAQEQQFMNAPEDVHEITDPFPGGPVEQMEMAIWVNFAALLTTKQARELKEFCTLAGIQIKPL